MNEVADSEPQTLTPSPAGTVEGLKAEILRKLTYSLGKNPAVAKPHDWLTAAILAARDHVVDVWLGSRSKSYATGR